MAIGKKTGGRDWKPGETGNPTGRPLLPGDVKEARKLNAVEFERIANKFLFITNDELMLIVDNPSTPIIEHLVASVLVKGIREGDMARLNPFLDRLIGKVTERVEHAALKPFVMRFLDGEEIVMSHKPQDEEE